MQIPVELLDAVRYATLVHDGHAETLAEAGGFTARRDALDLADLLLGAMNRPWTSKISILVDGETAGGLEIHYAEGTPLEAAEIGGILDRVRESTMAALRHKGLAP